MSLRKSLGEMFELRSARPPSAARRHISRNPPKVEQLEERTLLSFLPAVNYEHGSPRSVAVGDFNGDAKPDLVVANILDFTVSVLLGNGDGSFRQTRHYGVRPFPVSVAVADFNRDSKLDLVVAHGFIHFVSVYLGQGDGTFQPRVDYQTGGVHFSEFVVVGDFNRDGNQDLAAASRDDFSVGVLLGNGDGTFRAPIIHAVGGSQPRYAVVGDWNKDTKLDLLTANLQSNNVSLLLGNGDGTFHPPRTYGVGSEPFSLAVGDFDRDDNLDLAAANRASNTVSVLLGNGDGAFQAPRSYAVGQKPSSVAIADFNRDGKPDLAVANRNLDQAGTVSLLLGDGDGAFQRDSDYEIHGAPNSLAAGDFNADNLPDLITGNLLPRPSTISVLLNAADWFGSTTLLTSSANPSGIRQLVTFTATVIGDPMGAGKPSGMVTFKDGTVVLSAVPLNANGVATYTTATLAARRHTVAAGYSGGNNFRPSTSTSLAQVVGTANERLVDQIYGDLLRRSAEPSGLALWGALLDQGSNRVQVAGAMVSSMEGHALIVQELYTTYLKRNADPGGLVNWVAFLQGGATVQQLRARLAGSEEYFQLRGRSTNDGFLDALYQDALGRALDPTGRDIFRRAFDNGATPGQVAEAVFASPEYRERLVRGFYLRYLQRDADQTGLGIFLAALQRGTREQDIMAAIVGSDEYFGNV